MSSIDTDLDNAVLAIFGNGFEDDQAGSASEAPGMWAGLVRDGAAWADTIAKDPDTYEQVSGDELEFLRTEGRAGVIVFTDSQGFNTFQYYDDAAKLERDWEMTVEDLSVSDEDDPDYEPNARREEDDLGPSSSRVFRHYRIRQDDHFVAGEFPTFKAAADWARSRVRGFYTIHETDAHGNLLTPERHRANSETKHYDAFKGMSIREGGDEHAAQELVLYIENDAKLFDSNSQAQAIRKNLLRKIKKGVYDSKRAEQAWMYLMEAGAKAYTKEFGSSPRDWSTIFTKPTRELAAAYFAKDFEEEAKLGNFDHILT